MSLSPFFTHLSGFQQNAPSTSFQAQFLDSLRRQRCIEKSIASQQPQDKDVLKRYLLPFPFTHIRLMIWISAHFRWCTRLTASISQSDTNPDTLRVISLKLIEETLIQDSKDGKLVLEYGKTWIETVTRIITVGYT
jgi:hypothetical protein